ncbi:hypothetical protein FE784_06665 [Paenibacillus hemerocallicola]|uniref:Uncharacterized protein n=1 Tax=Paenibacillus hemerocallicola TaxID=1172614 RepID=A0A5C4TDW4_9BACL|nr:hypothetical protein [Paenibacillus hemerocallicola]TNJ67221.1 hypothetical protein FE784_06665 [Paenibacillus hemerocallicola]
MRKTLMLLLCSFLAGHLLLIFSWHEFSIFRYIYSLGALFIGIYYFKSFESKGLRISFVLMSLVFWVLLTVVYVAVGKIPILNLEPPGLKVE